MSSLLNPVPIVGELCPPPPETSRMCLEQTQAIDDLGALSLHVAMLTMLVGELFERIERDDNRSRDIGNHS